MLSKIRETTRELLRPAYAPAIRRLRRRLARNYFAHPEMELPPPYETIQLDAERRLHKYLHVEREDISQIVIVGAYEADELTRLRESYPRAAFLCFEPNPATFQRLRAKFAGTPNVSLSDKALGEAPGQARFYELKMAGNGSLLEPDADDWSRFSQSDDKEVVSFDVTVSTLNLEAADLPTVDLLWMDVQGAEGSVLKGGEDVLKRTRAIFLEVAVTHSPYKGAMLFPEISEGLRRQGFTCVGLGLDAWNGSGNALFVRQFADLICKPPG